jgi:hypothetical protein
MLQTGIEGADMSATIKFLIGLAAIVAMTWLHQGPLGNGEKLIGSIEGRAKAAVAASELAGIDVHLKRDPLSRLATLSGNADRFQREGQGSLKGLNDLVGEVEGVSDVRWADEAEVSTLPLFAELLLLTFAAYLTGIAISWLIWGRKRRDGFY